jgi:hypothetical protein
MQIDYTGSCHCAAIGFTYRTSVEPEQWSIRACQCSFCRAHDALSTSDPAGQIAFTAARPDLLQKYRFGLKTADFLLCSACGVYIGAMIETASGAFGIVNVHALLEKPENLAATAPIVYDNEDVAGRVSRREDRWTPVTKIPAQDSARQPEHF